MAGRVVVSTLNNDTGVLQTQNGMTGIAKAYVLFNGTNGSIYGTAFNVSSVTRNGTGDYTVNFTTAMPNANYTVAGGGGVYNTSWGFFLQSNTGTPRQTTSYNFFNANTSNTKEDSTYINAVFFSS